MKIYKIGKSNNLQGMVNISGAKNSALPILMATTLARGEIVFKKHS